MKAVVQRVRTARVLVDGAVVGEIGMGLCIFVGVAHDDGPENSQRLARRVSRLRLFENEEGRLDRNVVESEGSALVVSQFTLLADTAKGNRPSFSAAARPEIAEPLYESFCDLLRADGVAVERGVFGARMLVEIANDGPLTILLEA